MTTNGHPILAIRPSQSECGNVSIWDRPPLTLVSKQIHKKHIKTEFIFGRFMTPRDGFLIKIIIFRGTHSRGIKEIPIDHKT